MNPDYIIVQAGGKGTRLEHLTKNKPKCLVPVDNRPMIFNLFDKFPQAKFIIIGDYLFDVLDHYLYAFAEIKYITLKTYDTGTCAGIKPALDCIPSHQPFMLIWSDLILSDAFALDTIDTDKNYIGISKSFECRWSYEQNAFTEFKSKEHGVAGLFIFKDKNEIKDVPGSGEFVRWLCEKKVNFEELSLAQTKEIGILEEYNKLEIKEFRCRPFNQMEFTESTVVKKALTPAAQKLAQLEHKWYETVEKYELKNIPAILSYEPFTMEKVDGCNIFQRQFSLTEKKQIIDNIIAVFNQIHGMEKAETDIFSLEEAYITKTLKRLDQVRKLIPLAEQKYISINGKNCRNIFFFEDEFKTQARELLFDTEFALIHGDCTFSNLMIKDNLDIVLIDPRGYFGFTDLYGDIYYDWAKLYYSIYGNYDQFNNKNFDLTIDQDSVSLMIASNQWESMTDYFLSSIENINIEKLGLIHAIIWLSLTTYAWEDYDSICGAFYNGLYYLEDYMRWI